MAQDKLFNFSAGPAILPPEVFERAADAVRELRGEAHAAGAAGIGLSILEISHRSPEFTAIAERAIELCHSVLGIPESHEVMFLPGGASQQFAMVPLNLRVEGKAAAFVDTGVWSQKAIRESKLSQTTAVVASSKASGYDHIPEIPELDPAAHSYLHLTTNNTIYGTEFAEIPSAGELPVVIDCSSHIGSRPMHLERVALGYAGAQKNLGPSGLTVVFADKQLLETRVPSDEVPHFFRYATHASSQSMYNTPNTFGILVLMFVLEYMQAHGGVEGAGERNKAKADLLYAQLDASSIFTPVAKPGHRSQMNVSWTLGGVPEAEREAATKAFLADATAEGLVGLKGHRSAGGCRASIYNAFPLEGVQKLVEFMAEYERKA